MAIDTISREGIVICAQLISHRRVELIANSTYNSHTFCAADCPTVTGKNSCTNKYYFCFTGSNREPYHIYNGATNGFTHLTTHPIPYIGTL